MIYETLLIRGMKVKVMNHKTRFNKEPGKESENTSGLSGLKNVLFFTGWSQKHKGVELEFHLKRYFSPFKGQFQNPSGVYKKYNKKKTEKSTFPIEVGQQSSVKREMCSLVVLPSWEGKPKTREYIFREKVTAEKIIGVNFWDMGRSKVSNLTCSCGTKARDQEEW